MVDVLWCRGAPHGAAGWARRNYPVFAGGSRRARGSRVLGPWPTFCPACGEGGQEEKKVSVQAALSHLDADSLWGCGEPAPGNILAGYVRRSRPSGAAVGAL